MNCVALGEKPSVVLRSLAHAVSNVWSPFDDAVEDAILAVVGSPGCKDSSRRGLISWLAAYTIRLSTFSSASIGNKEAVNALEQCRAACQAGPAGLPGAVEKGLRRLLFPEAEGLEPQRVLTRAFSPRAEPLLRAVAEGEAMLGEVAHISELSMRLRSRSGRVILECHLVGQARTVGELTVDLPLVREALAWSSGRPGQTDVSAFIEPRLERCRASSVASLSPTQRRLIAITASGPVELS
jgi:hypothetical protein